MYNVLERKENFAMSCTLEDLQAVPSMAALTQTIRQNRYFPESWSSAVDSVCASCRLLGESSHELLHNFFMCNGQDFLELLKCEMLDPEVENQFKQIWSCLEGPPAIEAALMSVALIVHKSR